MIALAAAVIWAGYGVGTWGWCLVMGYDIPLTGWFSPFAPFTWSPDGNPGYVRKGQIFPGGAPGTASTAGLDGEWPDILLARAFRSGHGGNGLSHAALALGSLRGMGARHEEHKDAPVPQERASVRASSPSCETTMPR